MVQHKFSEISLPKATTSIHNALTVKNLADLASIKKTSF